MSPKTGTSHPTQIVARNKTFGDPNPTPGSFCPQGLKGPGSPQPWLPRRTANDMKRILAEYLYFMKWAAQLCTPNPCYNKGKGFGN